MYQDVTINADIDQILEAMPIGSVQRALGDSLYGINYTPNKPAVPRARESYGYTFFTRPQLNMSSDNLVNFRAFYNLLTQESNSYHRYIRTLLDPRLAYYEPSKFASPLLDNENAFMSVLTNSLTSLSGFPDITVPTYTSESGLYGEETSFVDGVTNHYEAFDVDATFKNFRGNPLLYLFFVWTRYQSLVYEGVLDPYPDMITENEIDYNTRIYRLVMDETRRYVSFIGATGASFPLNVPTGNLFDYNDGTPLNTRNSEINIRFRCMGFTAFEDVLKLEFNEAVAIFNPSMRALLEDDLSAMYKSSSYEEGLLRDNPFAQYGKGGFIKIPYGLMSVNGSTESTMAVGNAGYRMNHNAYPYINMITNELEWWISMDKYNKASPIHVPRRTDNV